jgi:hypothetical protein
VVYRLLRRSILGRLKPGRESHLLHQPSYPTSLIKRSRTNPSGFASAGSQLTRVLIDGGSGLNLLFASTLKKMGLDISKMLTLSKAPFYGIISSNAATPLGSLVLLVTFGTKGNYRTEYIKFEVPDFDSSYHAILGRLALAKFMAMPHYEYLLLKMPGKTGVLTLRGDLNKSYDCDQEAIEYATTSRVPEPSAEVLMVALKLTNTEMEISN